MANMRYQPQGQIRLSRTNPLTRGLIAAYVPRSGPRDATGTLATLVDVAPVLSQFGYVTPSLLNGPYPVVGTFQFVRTDPISAFVFGRFAVSNDANGAPVVSVGQTGGSNGWKFGPVGSGGNLILTFISVADYSTSVQFPTTGSVAFSATPGANARIFTNGQFRQQLGIGTPNNSLATARLAIGQRADGNDDSRSGSQVALALYWNRALSDAEQASLAANPWQIFDAPEEYEEVAVGAPASNTGTLAATLAAPTMSATGLLVNAGAFAATLAAPTMAASGIAATPPSGAFAATMAAPSMSAVGIATNYASFAATMAAPTMAAIGTAAPHATGTFAVTMPAPTMNAFGYLGGVEPVPVVRRYRWRILRRNIP